MMKEYMLLSNKKMTEIIRVQYVLSCTEAKITKTIQEAYKSSSIEAMI